MIVKASREAHHGIVANKFSFDEAYKMVSDNPGKEYRTTGNQAVFISLASKAIKGKHKGEKVIVFKSEGREMARSYPCCWGHITNCNRTYIDCYTNAL